MAGALGGLSPADRRREVPCFTGALGFASARIADRQSNRGPASDALWIYSWGQLLLVSLHPLLPAEERQFGPDPVPHAGEGTDRRQPPHPGAGRRSANHWRRRGRRLLARGSA